MDLDDVVDRSRFGQPDTSAHEPSVLIPGRNCWRIERAERASVLIDACEFFLRLDQAMRKARRSILIVGWDFDGRIKLRPDSPDCPTLGDCLRRLVEERPELQVHILVWSFAAFHGPSAPAELLLGSPWQDHQRIHLRLDGEHPFYASHHQKIICIDDSLAFVGGIDLTVDRWDTCDHDESNASRLQPDGKPYSPVHDVQSVMTGDAAKAVRELAHERWRRATGETLRFERADHDVWSDDLAPQFRNVPIAIARTEPGWRDKPPVEEIAELTIDLIKSARHSIYIEQQYFGARNVRAALRESLSRRNGPEIVVMATRSVHSFIERVFLGENRDRMVRLLRRVDRYNRLRVFYPIVPGTKGPCDVLIHSKVMVVDDRFVRVGSANMNHRSMGVDTECDVVIEATDAASAAAVAAVRSQLIGEHLGVTPQVLDDAVAREGSLIRGIESLNRGERGLRPYPEINIDGPTRFHFGTVLFDPYRPFEPLWWRSRRRMRKPVRAKRVARVH